MFIKIISIGVVCVFLSLTLKKYSPEFANIISVCGGILVFLLIIDEVKNLVDYFYEIYELTNLNFDFISNVLKIIGVGYITEFVADFANDSGNSIIASKILLGGKIVICGMSLPIIKKLLSVLLLFFS